MKPHRRVVQFLLACVLFSACGSDVPKSPTPSEAIGSHGLRVITPTLLELWLVTAKGPGGDRPSQWDFVSGDGKYAAPPTAEFQVMSGTNPLQVVSVGFRRRVIYAPIKKRDLRVGNSLFLQLKDPVPDKAEIRVTNPGGKLWDPAMKFTTTSDPLRWSPALHVNETGYAPGQPKEAMIGYYLGNLGELDLRELSGKDTQRVEFYLIRAEKDEKVYTGILKPRPDQGFPTEAYQKVWEADFSEFNAPGEYRLWLPGLGTSYPFFIDAGAPAAIARTYALGLYHQRCGTASEMPYTRFTHGPCHLAPAEVPDGSAKFASVNQSLEKETANAGAEGVVYGPRLANVNASLYPFVRKGRVDVSGGHHDAGDYSKYTINSAGLIHILMTAVDVFPGVSKLDNLGLPESGDGKSDVLQEAKWEADFLAKMQDDDGGFYFLVYPRDREYEIDVLPDHGDPQVVFPKTTSVTAAATAALAQCASSPAMKQAFPKESALYLEKAKKGWAFLVRALNKYGEAKSYQRITHYGDEFGHKDELAWAACELFLATGDRAYERRLKELMDPSDAGTRKWGWLRLYEAYGCAIRSYAFAVKSGRAKPADLDPTYLDACQQQVAAAGEDQLKRSNDSAYGTSLPQETKQARTAGWYFAADAAFDLAAACQVDYPELNDPRKSLVKALWANFDYELGCNPVNISYLTGLGWLRQHEIVHQYAQNDRRVLPPDGIPLGNIQAGLGWIALYEREPTDLSFPSDSDEQNPYPFYDRWSDAFNLTQEFVILHQARGLAAGAWLMAQSPIRDQVWKPVTGPKIVLEKASGNSGQEARLSAANLDLTSALTVWEAAGQSPSFGRALGVPGGKTPAWIEAEAQLPDGRRVFGVLDSKNQ